MAYLNFRKTAMKGEFLEGETRMRATSEEAVIIIQAKDDGTWASGCSQAGVEGLVKLRK